MQRRPFMLGFPVPQTACFCSQGKGEAVIRFSASDLSICQEITVAFVAAVPVPAALWPVSDRATPPTEGPAND